MQQQQQQYGWDVLVIYRYVFEATLIIDFGNMISGMRDKMMISGTINLQQTIFEAIGSKVNTTLIQAIITAEDTTQ
jgi:hypothetical protein